MIRGRFAAVLVVVVAAGCGSGSDGSPGWATRADKACAATEHAIGKRGAPIDLRDIDRVAVRAADDGHALFAKLRKLPLPDAGRARAQAVLDAVDRLEPRLDAFTQQSEIAAPRLMYDALKQARGDFDRLSRASKAAGLRECFTARDRRAAFDALLTPLFPGQLRDVFADRDWDLRDLQRRAPPRDPDLLDDYYAERHRIQAEARDRLEQLLAPERVKPQLERLVGILFDLEGEGTNPYLDASALNRVTDAYLARYEGRFRRLQREERRARRSLLRALRSPPADSPPPAASPA